jgi:DNA-binding transcriptional LysR family regulator
VDKFRSLFNRGGLSLDRLRNFVLIADAGGLSRAADGDPGRMSLFSRQIKELESFFGSALTRRQGRTLRLTEAGNQLAQLARAYLSGLEDFQQTCQGVPQTLSLAAGNSVLEWLLLPHLAKLRQALPNTRFELHTGRTQDLVQRLTDMSVDLALIREDAVVQPLKCQRLLLLTYSLFLPRQLATKVTPANLKTSLAGIPLATSIGGQFREQLTAAAHKAKWILQIELSCDSFTQAARAVAEGAFGGVLPSLARADFESGETVELALPFLKSYSRPMVVAWNPRLIEVRPAVERLRKAILAAKLAVAQ